MLLVGRIDSFLTFNEWLLSESIKPTFVIYGSNPPLFDDRKIIKYKGYAKCTCFITNNLLYSVQFSSKGEIAFGVSNNLPKDIKEFSSIKFSDERILVKSALNTFNKVFYVLVEMLKEQNTDVYFSAANNKLDGIYRSMIKNKFFNEELHKIGYSNIYYKDDYYKIDKI